MDLLFQCAQHLEDASLVNLCHKYTLIGMCCDHRDVINILDQGLNVMPRAPSVRMDHEGVHDAVATLDSTTA